MNVLNRSAVSSSVHKKLVHIFEQQSRSEHQAQQKILKKIVGTHVRIRKLPNKDRSKVSCKEGDNVTNISLSAKICPDKILSSAVQTRPLKCTAVGLLRFQMTGGGMLKFHFVVQFQVFLCHQPGILSCLSVV